MRLIDDRLCDQQEVSAASGRLSVDRESLIKCEANGENLQQQLDAANKANDQLRAGLAEMKSTLDKSMDQNAQAT